MSLRCPQMTFISQMNKQEIKMDHVMKKILTVRTFEIFNAWVQSTKQRLLETGHGRQLRTWSGTIHLFFTWTVFAGKRCIQICVFWSWWHASNNMKIEEWTSFLLLGCSWISLKMSCIGQHFAWPSSSFLITCCAVRTKVIAVQCDLQKVWQTCPTPALLLLLVFLPQTVLWVVLTRLMTNKASKAVAINLIENHIEHDLSDKQDMTRNKQRGMSDYDTTTASQEPQVPAHHLLARRWKRPECLWGHRATFLGFRRMNCLPARSGKLSHPVMFSLEEFQAFQEFQEFQEMATHFKSISRDSKR